MQFSGILNFKLQEQSLRQKSTVVKFPLVCRQILPGEQNPHVWHQHDSMEIAVVTSGTAKHILGNQCVTVKEGDVLLIAPGIIHGYEACADLGLYNVLYNPTKLPVPVLDGVDIPGFQRFFPAKLDDANEASNFSAYPVAHFPTREALDDAVREIDCIQQELVSTFPGNMFAAFVHLLALLVFIMRRMETTEDMSWPVQQWIFSMEDTLTFINNNLAKHIPLDQLAKMSNLSRRSFQYKFKRMTGYSLTDYLLRKRLAQAKTMLRKNPYKSIPDIAFDCGFEDPAYFSRQFRKAFDITPSHFRNGGINP